MASPPNTQSTASLDVTPSSASGVDPVIEWDEITRDAIAANASSPAVASRVLAIESLAVYNAVAAIDGTAGFQSDLTAPAGADASAAVIAAADAALDALFPDQAAAFDAQATADLGPAGGIGETEGIAVGQQSAAGELVARANDGAAASVTDSGGTAPTAWQPTAAAFAPATTPQWATVTPFGLQSPNQFAPAAPPAIGSAAYAAAVNQTYSLGALNSTTRSPAETQMALFFNDPAGTDMPAGQWNQIAATVAQANGESLASDALLFAELNVAEADSAIATSNGAFTYNAPRPVTVFTDPAFAAANPAIDGSSTWQSLLATPNSPEYPEALGAFSNSAAAVLSNFFGANTSFTATSESDPGVTLPFNSFAAAASDAAMSGIYGGIAFSFSATAGQTLGTQIGNWTLGLFSTTALASPSVIVNTPSGGATNQVPAISGAVSPSSGVTALDARLPGGTTVVVPVSANGDFSYTPPVPLGGTADGAQVVTFSAINSTGTVSPAVNFTFMLLTQAPSINFSSNSVTNVGSIGAAGVLDGSIGLEADDALRSLTYAFDGGTAISVAVNPATGAFDATLNDATLTAGQHQLTVTAEDIAGNTTTKNFTVNYALAPLVLTGITPSAGANDVGVTFRPTITFSRPVNPSTLNGADFYATNSSGAVLPATIIPFADGTGASLVPTGDFSGASTITLHVVGQDIMAATDSAALDAADSGLPGSSLVETYSTVSTSPVTGTTITGVVVDPGADGTPFTPDDVTSIVGNDSDFASDVWKLPIAGAKVYVLGDEASAVTTSANGSFTLTNVPAGDVKVVVDGTTTSNAPAGYSFPVMTFDINVKAGTASTVAGDLGTPAAQAGQAGDPAVYLPRVATDALTPVSGTTPTTVTATPDSEFGSGSFVATRLSLTVLPNAIVGANGEPISNPKLGIAPVPMSIAQEMLLPGPMQNSFMVSVQAPGATLFTSGASMTLPNVTGLAAGEQTYIFSIDPATGHPVIAGTATASADGQTVTTDPGKRITGPGLYGMTPGGSYGTGNVGSAVSAPAALAGAEAQANQSALALVSGANAAVGAGLTFANAASAGSDIASAVSSVGADAQTIRGNPTAASGFATLAADALHDAINISLDIGVGLPGPFGQWAAGLQAANTAVAFYKGMAATVAGLQANVNAISTVTPAGGQPFGAIVASVDRGISNELAAFQRIASDLKTLSVLDELNLTLPDLGIASGQLATIEEQLPAIVNAFDDYMLAAQQLAGQPTALGLADAVANGLAAVEGAKNAAAYQEITPTPPAARGLSDNGLGAPVQDAETTLYATIQGSDGSIQRLSFTADQGYGFLFGPNTFYQIMVFDPASNSIGESFLESEASGQNTNIPLAGLTPDPAARGADGLTPTEAFVLGVNNATADNLISGVTDLAALQGGLYNGGVSTGSTGIVASLPVLGSAKAVALAGSSSGSTTYAYIATGNEGLAVADVTNPDSPVVLGQIALGGNATEVAVSSTLGIAAVANGSDLALIDVGDPTALAVVQTIQVNASVVRIIGGMAYANNGGALESFDLATGNSIQTLRLGSAVMTGMAVAGSTIYTMDSSDVLRVIDTSSGSMVLDGAVTLPAGGNQIFAANGVVYVGAGNATSLDGYLTVDVSNPAAPALIAGSSNTAIAGTALVLNGSGTGVSVQQSSAAGGVLSVFNTTAPTNTGQFIAQYNLPAQPFDVAIDDAVGLVADGASGLQVVNYLATDTSGMAPVVTSVTGPTDVDSGTAGTQIYAGAPVTVSATVTDNVQVLDVELLLNGTVVANSTRFPFAMTATMPSVAGGATLQVEAIDTGGNTALSTPIPVQIVPDARAFNVLNENVTQGGTLDRFAHAITLAFSKPLNPSSITPSDIEVLNQSGTAVSPQSMTLSDGNQVVSLNFGTLAPGSYQLAIDAPLIADDSGGTLGLGTLTTGFTVQEFTAEFGNSGSGSWNTGSNWSTGSVPGPADSVSLGTNGAMVNYDGNNDSVANLAVGATGGLNVAAGGLTVSDQLQVNGQVTVGGGALAAIGSVSIGATGGIQVNNRAVTLDNVAIAPGGSIQVGNNDYLIASGVDANAGLIALNSVGNDTRVIVAGALSLTNTGTVRLSDNPNNLIASNGAAATLTDAGNTIAGAGQIGDGLLALNNEAGGTIDATGTNNLIIQGGNDTNTGLMEDTGPAALLLRSAAIIGSGTIAAPVANSTVNLQSSSITGGTLQDANGGVIQEIDRGSTIDDVTLTTGSNLHVTNSQYLTAAGSLTNEGTVFLDSHGNDTRLISSGSVTLIGTGTVQLSDNPNNLIASNGTAATLTNAGNTITGAGQVGDGSLSLNNEAGGTINATGTNNLIIQGGNDTNAGLMEGTGPAALLLRSTSITNSGTIAAPVANSTVDLQSSSITGGTLRDANGGVIQEIDRGSTVNNVTLTTGSNLHVINNEFLTIAGSLTNEGTVFLDSGGNDTRLISSGSVTLTGTGTVQLSNNPVNLIASNGAAATLTNAGNTIAGAGQIGDGLLTLNNGAGGTINATGTNNLIIQGGNDTNAGLMEDTGPAALLLHSTSITNSGTIAAPVANSTVDLQSSSITGGTLRDENGGVIQEIDRGSTVNNVTLTTGSNLHVINNEFLTIAGSLTNEGTVYLDLGGNDTRLISSGGVTLTGGGVVQLSDNGVNLISGNSGAVLLNVDNTIQGSGQIGDNVLTLRNGVFGTIDATGTSSNLVLTGLTTTNAGLIEDTGPKGLRIASTTILNSGTIAALLPGSHVDLASATIDGGVLATANGGVINETDRGSVLDNVAISIATASTLVVLNNQYLTVIGTLTNQGTIALASVGNDTRLITSGTVALVGGGLVQLSDNGGNSLTSNGAAAVLINVDNLIAGGGQLGDSRLSIDNASAGVIDASATSALIIGLAGGTLTNVGTIESTSTVAGNGGLLITNSTIDNSGSNNAGVIVSAGTNSHVNLQSAFVLGGTLTTAQGGFFQEIDRGSTIEDVTLAAGSVLHVVNNEYLTVAGPLTNRGTIHLDSGGNDTRLFFNGSATLTGTGVIQLSDNANNTISGDSGAVLTNVDNIIQGSGQIGDGVLTFDNALNGTVDATGTGAQLILAGGMPIANAGLIESTGPAGLRIASTTVNNSGTIAAPITGSHVDLFSATINGGVLAAANGGFFQELDRGSTLNGVTIAAGGVVAVNNNTFLTLQGIVTNEGTIQVKSGGSDTRLMVVSGLTLTGGGTVQMTDNGGNSILSVSPNTAFTILNGTVEGAGVVGDSSMTITLGANGAVVATGNNGLTLSTVGNAVGNGGLLQSAGAGGLSVTGAGGVNNGGTIWADGDGLFVAGNVSGTGADRISGGATFRIGGAVAAGQSVTFDPGSTGTLRIDDSQQFGGTVFGLATSGINALDLSDISFINGTSTTAKFSNGLLTVTDGSHSATIALAGNYTGQAFVTSSDGHNGTTVIDPDLPAASLPNPFAATVLGSWAEMMQGSTISPEGAAFPSADLLQFASVGPRSPVIGPGIGALSVWGQPHTPAGAGFGS